MQPDDNSESEWIPPAAPSIPAPIAPVWHTVVLVIGIVLLSVAGAAQLSAPHAVVHRMQTYAMTAGTEFFMLAWVYFGLRLRKIPFRSLLGSFSGSFRPIVRDLGIALAFWMGSLFILANVGIFWTVIEAAIKHQPLLARGKQLAAGASQQQTLHTLTQLAPTNAREIAAWVGLCILAGFAEETVFRGYLQQQFTAFARGAVAVGVIVSAAMFGMAHGYQGARNMALLAVFGALFSLLAVYRRSLRPGMIAHSWHDLIAGLMLAFLRAHHKL